MTVRIATRGSVLARWQAERVAALLQLRRPGLDVELVTVETTGDRRTDLPVALIGGQGVFVKEVQAAVLDGRADLAVHSAKDLPSLPTEGLHIGAFPERADPRDALAGGRLADLPSRATVMTGSVRRRAQLAAVRPDLRFADVRGNVPTRLGKLPPGGVLVVAAAALDRLGLADRATELLAPDVVLPQVGQGALAVECRADDGALRDLLAGIDDPDVRAAVEAERAFLARLGGGCDLPVGALAGVGPDGEVTVDAVVASLDGTTVLRGRRSGPRSSRHQLGTALADELGGAAVAAGLEPASRW